MAAVGQGNLSERLEVEKVTGEDELLAKLGQQLNDSTASLSTMIHQIREASRSTQGVRLLSLDPGDKVAAAVVIPREEEDENGLPLQ